MSLDLERIYRNDRQGLYTLALAVTGSPQLAEDAIHDAFAKVCSNGYRQANNLRAYIFSSVRNAAIDINRRNTVQQKTADSIFQQQSGQDSSSAEKQLLSDERAELLGEAIERLPEGDREIVVLKVFAELTFDEIGQIVDAPMKTVASRYRRALSKLADQLRNKL